LHTVLHSAFTVLTIFSALSFFLVTIDLKSLLSPPAYQSFLLQVLKGEALKAQIDKWVTNGIIELGCGTLCHVMLCHPLSLLCLRPSLKTLSDNIPALWIVNHVSPVIGASLNKVTDTPAWLDMSDKV
jgi:hypothetical protein